MQHRARVAVVEDDKEIRMFLEAALHAEGYDVETLSTAETALHCCQSQPVDALILDLGLPDMDGKEVIKRLRGWSSIPIIVLSARDQEQEKVEALELGADDYLTKPFGTQELIARTKVALRRNRRREILDGEAYQNLGLSVDLSRRQVMLDGLELRLTPTEYKLLSLLTRKCGQVVTQAEILREVWGKKSEENDHYLRIYIQRLRQKLGDSPLQPRFIFTEPGIGYRLVEDKISDDKLE